MLDHSVSGDLVTNLVTKAHNCVSVVLRTIYPPDNGQNGVLLPTVLHATIFLFPAAAIALPKPSPRDMGIETFTGFSVIGNTWVSLVFGVPQLVPQYLEYRRFGGSLSTLSVPSLAMRAVLSAVLAVRWLQRLGRPTWGRGMVPVTMWYQWGWLEFNQLFGCVGYVVLMWMYVGKRSAVGGGGERTPLLL